MGKHNYMMGLYIQECPKMRYKGTFKGTRLLCSYTHQFVPIESARNALEKKESRLYPDEKEADRIHEENAKLCRDYCEQVIYIFYNENMGGIPKIGMSKLPPKCRDMMEAICEFIPTDCYPLFYCS